MTRFRISMRYVLCALTFFVANLGAHADVMHGRVAHIVDGDTLDVIVQGKRIRVRILDIDAPEHAQPYAHRSRQSLIALCGGEAAQIDGNKHDQRPVTRTRAL